MFSRLRLGPCGENCWDAFPKLLQQADSLLLVIRGEMGRPQGLTDVLVSAQFLHRWQADARHHQATRKGMLQIVAGEMNQPSLLHSVLKRRAE